jgi:predicted nucleic acid-binding protein
LLAYPNLTKQEECQIRLLLKKRFKVIPLSKKVGRNAILIRSQTRLRLPDAVIAATAVSIKASLVSGDSHLLTLDWPELPVIGI